MRSSELNFEAFVMYVNLLSGVMGILGLDLVSFSNKQVELYVSHA